MKNFSLLVAYILISISLKSQVNPDSLLGIYEGQLWIKEGYNGVWNITPATEIVLGIDTSSCFTILDGALTSNSGYNTTFWTDYTFCNGFYNPPDDPTGLAYPKFFAGDSLLVYKIVPQPYPNPLWFYKRFLGKRIPGTGSVDIGSKAKVNISQFYPNPGNGSVTFDNSWNFTSYELFDIHGNRLASDSVDPQSFPLQLDFSFLNPGIYMIRLIGGNTIHSGKIAIQ